MCFRLSFVQPRKHYWQFWFLKKVCLHWELENSVLLWELSCLALSAGVLTAVILAMGRIVGESAALLFTSGLSYNMPSGFFSQIMSSGRTLTLHLYQTARERLLGCIERCLCNSFCFINFHLYIKPLASLLSKVLKKG